MKSRHNTDEDSFHAGEELGHGAEHVVLSEGHSEESQRIHNNVLKLPIDSAALWKTESAEFIRKCIASLVKNGFRVPPIEVHTNRIVRDGKGRRKREKYFLREPKINNIEDKVLSFEDLTDPKDGPHLLRELVRYVRAADRARKEDKLGYDPVGSAMFIDLAKGVYQRTILALTAILPEKLANPIQQRIQGIQSKVRNIIVEKIDGRSELVFADVGMLDFSERGKFKWIMQPIHYFAFAGLIQLIKYSNAQLPPESRIPETELNELPYAQELWSNIPAKISWKILAPLFERYQKNSKF